MSPSKPWPVVVAALTLIALLVAFHQVVRGAVRQGETRRQATATLADAVWRCKTLPSPRVRVDCLLQLDSARLPIPLVPAQVPPVRV
jgi:hypothetical protein